MSQDFKEKARFCLYFVVIVSVSLAVFYPSFQHTFRSDQIVYFANTRAKSELIPLCKDYYAYPQVRYYFPGDAFLFRPLTFVLLGFEKAAFGMHYAYWHLFSFVLHMLTVFFLFRILYDIRAGIFAFLFSLLYACLYANMEAVIWEHISGYVLFNVLVLGGFFYFKRSFEGGRRNDLAIVLFFLLTCSFLHEWGNLFCILFGICFYFKNKQAGRIQDNWKVGLFFIPLVVYALAYFWVMGHYWAGHSAFDLKVTPFVYLWHVIGLVPQYFCQLLINGLFPSLLAGKITGMSRLSFDHKSVFSPWFLFNLTAVMGMVFFIIGGFSKDVVKHNRSFLFLLAGIMSCQIISMPLIRLLTHGEKYILQDSSYYGYFFWSFALVAVYMLVDWPSLELSGNKVLKTGRIMSMAALILLNAGSTWEMNQVIKEGRWAWQQYIDKLNRLVELHGKEKDFSFFIRNDVQIDLAYRLKGSKRPAMDKLNLASIFYFPYYNDRSPKYIFLLGEDDYLHPLLAQERFNGRQ